MPTRTLDVNCRQQGIPNSHLPSASAAEGSEASVSPGRGREGQWALQREVRPVSAGRGGLTSENAKAELILETTS